MKATIEHEIATGTFDYAKHFPESKRAKRINSAGIPLLAAMLDYCDSLAEQLEPETVDEYRHDAEIVAKWFPGKTLQTITRADIRLAVSKLALSKKRIDNLLIPLRGTLSQAVEDGLESNPIEGFRVRRIRRERDTIDPFTKSEIAALAGTELGHVWEFWAWTGLRSGELIGLQRSDVGRDFASLTIGRAVRVGREKGTKTRRGNRVLHLLSRARDALRSAHSGMEWDVSEPVFTNPNTGERWHEDRGLARAFRKACDAAGVRYRYPYQLRHTFASWALSSGENPLWVAAQLGHADVSMIFKVYGKYMPSMNPSAGQKMSESKAA